MSDAVNTRNAGRAANSAFTAQCGALGHGQSTSSARLAAFNVQAAAGHCRSAAIAVVAGQTHVASARLGKAAGSEHEARVGARRGLIEDHPGIVSNASPQAACAALQSSGADRRTTEIGIGAAQNEGSRSSFGQIARSAHHSGVGAGSRLVEGHRGAVGNVALEAGRRAGQAAGGDRGSSAVIVGSGQGEGATANFDQLAGAGHRASVSPRAGLLELNSAIVRDVTLHAARGTGQRAGAHRSTTPVSVRTRQGQRSRT